MTNPNINATGFDNSVIGKNTITISYGQKTINFDVEIVSKPAGFV